MFLRENKSCLCAQGLGKILFKIALFIIAGAIFLYPGYRRLRIFGQKLERLKENVRVLEEKNRELKEEIEALEKDSFYLEKLAREMGLVKDGEVVYKIREEEGEGE